MRDRSSELINEHELKFSHEQGFFDRSLIIKLLIGLTFVASLFLFLHFREVRVEVLELNSIAPGYVVAQLDFDFLDEEATAILKQEAVQEVGKIYRIQDKEIRQRHMAFENFLIYNQEWRKYVENSTFDALHAGGDAIEKVMMQLQFTDTRTLQKLKEAKIPTSFVLIYIPLEISKEITLPQQVWNYMRTAALAPLNMPNAANSFLIGYFQHFKWTVIEDIPTEKKLRHRLQQSVPAKYTRVSAGSRIIDQGERVTTRHIAMMQAMKNALHEKRNLNHPLTLLGNLMLACLLAGICIIYLKAHHPTVLASNRMLALLVTIILLTLAISKATEWVMLSVSSPLVELIHYPIFVVFAAILICSLMNPAIATFSSAFLVLVMTIALAFERQGFLLVNISAALVAIFSTHSLSHRKEIFVICAKAWLCAAAMILAIYFSKNILWSSSLFVDLISAAICLLLTGIAVVGLLPLLESTFHVMTDVTLTEYMDPNNDVLRRLSIEAPGTYQHSIVVGNAAEAAAVAIGANGLFCRVATLYHDIGKMVTPQYFTENQHGGGVNIHQLLTPAESAAVIIAHVSEGVAIGRKAGLPEPFIDIIKEHHGTTLVYYFYRKELERAGGDKSKDNAEQFRYAGPKPRSKESGIIMLADTIEAASRSLETIDEKSLSELAARLVREKMEDKQFDHCLLTMEELSVVVATLVKTLIAYSHTRVKYPTREVRKEMPLITDV